MSFSDLPWAEAIGSVGGVLFTLTPWFKRFERHMKHAIKTAALTYNQRP